MTVLAGLAVYTGIRRGYLILASDSRSVSYDAQFDDHGNIVEKKNVVISDDAVKVFKFSENFVIGYAGELTSSKGHPNLMLAINEFINDNKVMNDDLSCASKKIFEFILDNIAEFAYCSVIIGGFNKGMASLSSFQVKPKNLNPSIRIDTPLLGMSYAFSFAGVNGQEPYFILLREELKKTSNSNKEAVLKLLKEYIQSCADLDLEGCNNIVQFELLE